MEPGRPANQPGAYYLHISLIAGNKPMPLGNKVAFRRKEGSNSLPMNEIPFPSRFWARPRALIGLCLGLVMALLWTWLLPFPARADQSTQTGDDNSFLIGLWPLVDGLVEPTTITSADDSRLFVVERAGRIRVVNEDGLLLTQPFLDIVDRVGSADNWEQGLIGLAFHPDFASNGLFYVNYTDLAGDSQIARFRVNNDNPNIADANSEIIVLSVEQPTIIHNGGQLAFGPDGYLYIGLGDGGWLGDPDNNAQDLELMLGKILRIAVSTGNNPPFYTVPNDNPFVGVAGAAPEIWAVGLRNPWRFSFDRSTGDLYIGDVGNTRREEINYEPAGSPGGFNYGWRCYEGNLSFNLVGCGQPSDYTFPIHDYPHYPGCAVTGGYVYRGNQYPIMNGHYLFADLCSGDFWSLERDPATHQWQTTWRGSTVPWLSTFGEAADGELYVADYFGGTVYRVTVASTLFNPLALFNSG